MAKQKFLTDSMNESSYAAITKVTKRAQRILTQENVTLRIKRRDESEEGNKETTIKREKREHQEENNLSDDNKEKILECIEREAQEICNMLKEEHHMEEEMEEKPFSRCKA